MPAKGMYVKRTKSQMALALGATAQIMPILAERWHMFESKRFSVSVRAFASAPRQSVNLCKLSHKMALRNCIMS